MKKVDFVFYFFNYLESSPSAEFKYVFGFTFTDIYSFSFEVK